MDRILRNLPRKPRSALLRFGIATGLVTFCFAVLLGLQRMDGVLGFYLLLPSIFVAAILLDRSAGIYAAVLSTVLLYFLLTPQGTVFLPRQFVIPLFLYFLVALGFALVSEALRRALEQAAAAERSKDLLLRELGHRTKNNLSMVISMLSMQAKLKSNPEARQALEKAITRIHAIARAHEHFRPFEQMGSIEMRTYLQQLCAHLADALRDVRPIVVNVEATELYLPSEQAVPLGLIVNELVTNSLKHAFPGDLPGTVHVALSSEAGVVLVVRDDGIGCPIPKEGTGARLTRLLAQQLGGTIAWEHCEKGCLVRVSFALPKSATRASRQCRIGRIRVEPSRYVDGAELTILGLPGDTNRQSSSNCSSETLRGRVPAFSA
jgi:two-component system, sensor histidine kinase PdtaS